MARAIGCVDARAAKVQARARRAEMTPVFRDNRRVGGTWVSYNLEIVAPVRSYEVTLSVRSPRPGPASEDPAFAANGSNLPSARRRADTRACSPPEWPHLKCSPVAAFECSVTQQGPPQKAPDLFLQTQRWS